MKPNKTTQEMKMSNYLALLAIVTILVVLAGGLAIKTFGSSFLVNQKVLNKKSVANKTLDSDLKAVDSILSDYEGLGAGALTIKNIMPTDSDMPGLANAVEAMASTTGTTLKDVNNNALAAPTSGTTGIAGPQSVPVTIAGNVSYPNLIKFLGAIESSARPIRISAVSLTGTNANLNVQVTATTFFQPATTFNVTTQVVK